MKRLLIGSFMLWIMLTHAAAAADCGSLDALDWMAGHWESRDGGVRMTEQWTRVSPYTAEGVGEVRSWPENELKSRETLRLVSMSGSVYYLAKVAHNPMPVAFTLTECSDRTALFENPQHDFPNLIAYRLGKDGVMRVEVRGSDGGGFDLRFEAAPPPVAPRIALTFDDAPRGDSLRFTGPERTERLLESLASVDAPPAIFFSVGGRVDEQGNARLRRYQEAGHYIANHSHSHQRIDSLGVEAWLADVEQAHDLLSAHPGFLPLFRYPFLDEGRDRATRDRLRAGLAELGYGNGYVTIDNYDWYMDHLLQRALEQGRVINEEKLEETYVRLLLEAVRFYDDIAARYLATPPVHVLLLHENDLAALYVDELVTALRAEGWEVVDARQAYREAEVLPVPDTLFNGQGRVAAIAESQGASRRELVHAAEDTDWLESEFERRNIFMDATADSAR